MPSNVAGPVDQQKLVRTAAAGVLAALVIAALYFGRPVLVPFALAVLLAFALSPAAEFLRRIGLPRALAVVLTVTAAVFLIGGFGTFVGTQIGLLAAGPAALSGQSHAQDRVGARCRGRQQRRFERVRAVLESRQSHRGEVRRSSARHTGFGAGPRPENPARHPGRGPATRSRALPGGRKHRRSAARAAGDAVAGDHLRRLHPSAKRRPAEPVHFPGGGTGPAAHQPADRRRRQEAQPLFVAADERQRLRRTGHRFRPVALRRPQSRSMGP